jgi:hypothetical protein
MQWGLLFAVLGGGMSLVWPFGIFLTLPLSALAFPFVPRDMLVASYPAILAANWFVLGAAWRTIYDVTPLCRALDPVEAASGALLSTVLAVPGVAFLWLSIACQKASC